MGIGVDLNGRRGAGVQVLLGKAAGNSGDGYDVDALSAPCTCQCLHRRGGVVSAYVLWMTVAAEAVDTQKSIARVRKKFVRTNMMIWVPGSSLERV